MREFGAYGMWSSGVALAAGAVLWLFVASRGQTVLVVSQQILTINYS